MYNDLLRKDKELYPYGMALKKKKIIQYGSPQKV